MYSDNETEKLTKLARKIYPDVDTYVIAGNIFLSSDNTKIPQEDIDAAILLTDKEDQISEKYLLMVADIYAEMKVVFGTSNDASASAFASTYEAMVKRPANYVDAELGFADETAVTTFAEAKIALADAYGVFRMKRIAQYESEKAATLA